MIGRRGAAVIAVLALGLSACATGGDADLVTYTDPGRQSLFSIPGQWNLYELGELSSLGTLPFVQSVQGIEFPAIDSVAFDGAPVRDVGNLTSDLADAQYPIGASSVRTVTPDAKDFISRYVLTQSVLPYLDLQEPQEIQKEDFSFGKGFEGVRVLVAYTGASGQSIGVAYLISVTDPDDRRLYSIIAGCSRDCFIENQQAIEEVIDSWLVNTRD